MRSALLATVLALAAIGCAQEDGPGAPEAKPGQVEAEEMVWHGVYGMEGPAPVVYWQEGAALNCGGGAGFVGPVSGVCVFGEANAPADEVQVAWTDKLSDTELVHEWCHVRSWLRTGDADPGHQGECFLGGLTIVAKEALRGAGL